MHILSQVGAWMQLSRPAEASSPTPRSTSDVATTRASNQFQGLPTKARYLSECTFDSEGEVRVTVIC